MRLGEVHAASGGRGLDAQKPRCGALARRGGDRDSDRGTRLPGPRSDPRTPLPTCCSGPVYSPARRRIPNAAMRNRVGTASNEAPSWRNRSAYSMCRVRRATPMPCAGQRGTVQRRSPIALIDLSIRICASTFGLKHKSRDHGETSPVKFVKNLRIG